MTVVLWGTPVEESLPKSTSANRTTLVWEGSGVGFSVLKGRAELSPVGISLQDRNRDGDLNRLRKKLSLCVELKKTSPNDRKRGRQVSTLRVPVGYYL